MARLLTAAVFLTIAISATASAQVTIDARVEKPRISVTENATVQIEVRAEGSQSAQVQLPDFEGFEVVQRHVQRPMQFNFGFGAQTQVKTTTQYRFVLRPLTAGRHTIAATRVKLGDAVFEGRPITIEVVATGQQPQQQPGTQPQAQPQSQVASSQPPAGTLDGAEFDDYAFLRTVVDKARPFEREQVTVTVYLYIRDQLRSAPHVATEPSTDGFWTRDLLPTNRNLTGRRQAVNGVNYAVYVVRRFAAFPLRSGELTVGAMSIKSDMTSMFDAFRGQGKREIQRTGVPVTIDVQPLPEVGRPPGDVAVGRFSIAAKLDRTQAITGDAVTLTATVKGTGHIRTVVLPTPSVDGLEVLQPQMQEMEEAPNDLVVGARSFEWLIVPQRPGEFGIPPIVLHSFDPATGQYSRVESAPLSLVAAGKVLAGEPPPSAPEPEEAAPPDVDSHEWPPIRTTSRLSRRKDRIVSAPWYPWALAFAPLLWLALITSSRARSEIARRRQLDGPQKLLRDAKRRLEGAAAKARAGEAAGFHAEATAALQLILESRVDEPIGSLTHDELTQRLIAWELDSDVATKLVDLLKRADFARFSPAESSAQELSRQLTEVREVFQRVASFQPTRSAS